MNPAMVQRGIGHAKPTIDLHSVETRNLAEYVRFCTGGPGMTTLLLEQIHHRLTMMKLDTMVRSS